MSNVTTLSTKFQISIPKEVRDAQNWKAGQQFAFVPRGIARGANPEGYRDRDDRY
jgi:AbrB family looped-hinge helix DNA binding protein